MKKRIKVVLTAIVLLVILYFFSSSSEFISNLTGKVIYSNSCIENITLYVRSDCPNCIEQEATLGNLYKRINKVHCPGNPECKSLLILPAWKVDGKVTYEIKSKEEIEKTLNCN